MHGHLLKTTLGSAVCHNPVFARSGLEVQGILDYELIADDFERSGIGST